MLVPKLVFALACLCALVTPGVCLVTTGPVTKTNLSISWSAGAALVLKCWGPGLAWAVRVLQWRDWSAFVGLQLFRYAGLSKHNTVVFIEARQHVCTLSSRTNLGDLSTVFE